MVPQKDMLSSSLAMSVGEFRQYNYRSYGSCHGQTLDGRAVGSHAVRTGEVDLVLPCRRHKHGENPRRPETSRLSANRGKCFVARKHIGSYGSC